MSKALLDEIGQKIAAMKEQILNGGVPHPDDIKSLEASHQKLCDSIPTDPPAGTTTGAASSAGSEAAPATT